MNETNLDQEAIAANHTNVLALLSMVLQKLSEKDGC